MRVLKFGGTSVGTPERIQEVVEILRAAAERRGQIAVVSAFSGVTDSLVAMANSAAKGEPSYKQLFSDFKGRHLSACAALATPDQHSRCAAFITVACNELEDILQGIFALRECTRRTLDQVMSFGERLSASIVATAAVSAGIESSPVDARLFIRTDNNYGSASVDFAVTNDQIRSFFNNLKSLSIVTGFIGSAPLGETTTLGRGGSDYTASIIGAALGAEEIEIWTDVDGVMTADPRMVKKAIALPALSYEEAMELSHFGAKVIYPPTIAPAYQASIPISIRNSFNANCPGTLIHIAPAKQASMIAGISSIPEVSLIRVQGPGMQGVSGTAGRVFKALSKGSISVILITQASSEHTICFAVEPNQVALAQKLIHAEFEVELLRGSIDQIVAEDGFSAISVVGEQMRNTPGISARLFGALGNNAINVAAIAQGSSELNISIVIPAKDRKKALNAIHDAFFLSDARTANLFVVGVGLIGQTLMSQLKEHRDFLKTEYHLEVKLVGIANTTRMRIDENGIEFNDKLSIFASDSEASSLEAFIDKMTGLNLPNCVMVDCTSSLDVAKLYPKVLEKNISVVTPNKKGFSADTLIYQSIKKVARRRGAKLLYETSVGAGLPVISTLLDLLKSGDEVLEIEGVFSGTLSYVFNQYSGRETFSTVLRQAHQAGFTEPDPRDDLSGLDIARKLLILAREIGFSLELSDVMIENLIPPASLAAQAGEPFFKALEQEESWFRTKLDAAMRTGKRLCYVASLRGGAAKIALEAIGPEHPFFGLSGSDNIISFRTRRYDNRPLVVKGPGAGAEVTAAGVLADIIRIIQ